jgi:hypothetical protein
MTPQFDEAAIRQAAYFLWLNEGQPMGSEQEFWFRAEAELNTPAPKKKSSPRKPATRKAAPKAEKTTSAAKPRARKAKATAKT